MERIPTRKQLPAELRNIIMIALGLLCTGAAYRMYLVPNNVTAGGFTGIGQLLNHLFGIRVGLVTAALNIPLFLVSMRKMGLRFGLRSFASMLLLSFVIDYLPIAPATDDLLLATIFGGVLGGLGFGLILRGNATTGGTDMLASLVVRYVPVLKIGMLIFAFDGLIILGSAFVFDQTAAMYALICTFLMNTVIDFVLNGPNTANCYIIISDKSQQIAERVMSEMERGVTSLKGRGMYSGTDRDVLLCVINRFESMTLRRIIFSIDPKAFVIVEKTHEVFGEGFSDTER